MVEAGAGLGALPGVSASLGGGLGYLWRRWAIRARGAHELRRSTGAGAPGVAVQLSYGALATGPRLWIGERDEIRPQLGVELGSAQGRGFRVPSAATDRVFWRALTAGAMYAHAFGSVVFISVEADLRVTLGDVRFVVAGGRTLHALGPVAGSARLGVGARF